jgi:hypothetical protein
VRSSRVYTGIQEEVFGRSPIVRTYINAIVTIDSLAVVDQNTKVVSGFLLLLFFYEK